MQGGCIRVHGAGSASSIRHVLQAETAPHMPTGEIVHDDAWGAHEGPATNGLKGDPQVRGAGNHQQEPWTALSDA